MTAAVLAAAMLGGPADSAAVLRSLEQAGRSLKTMKASFVEVKVNVLLGEEEESRGEVLLQVPGRFRFQYEAPQESVTLVCVTEEAASDVGCEGGVASPDGGGGGAGDAGHAAVWTQVG